MCLITCASFGIIDFLSCDEWTGIKSYCKIELRIEDHFWRRPDIVYGTVNMHYIIHITCDFTGCLYR